MGCGEDEVLAFFCFGFVCTCGLERAEGGGVAEPVRIMEFGVNVRPSLINMWIGSRSGVVATNFHSQACEEPIALANKKATANTGDIVASYRLQKKQEFCSVS